jgi:xanthine dehydrogenase YagS FAD-binding subunit
VRIRGAAGERTVPFGEFHTTPGEHPEIENVLRPGELITAVDIAPMSYATRSAYVKVRDRASYAFALASAAVALDIAGGRIRAARIAMGGVGTRPWRAVPAEAGLTGATPGEDAWRAAAAAAVSGAVTQPGNAFKVALARRTMVRTLRAVAQLT